MHELPPSLVTPTATKQRSLRQFGGDEQFRRLVESVTDYAIFMLDPHGTVVTWNVGAERLKGYRAEEIIGLNFSCFYPPEALTEGLPARALELAATNGRLEEEGWRLRKDGSRFWANVSISPIRDDDGALAGFAKVTRDLTERRNVEIELQKESRRLTSILDCVSDAVAVCNTEGIFVQQNRAAINLAGPRRQDGDGVTDSTQKYGVFRADGVTPFPPSESTLLRALKGESSDGVEAVMRNPASPDGVFLRVNTRPLIDESGKVTGAVTVAHDMSDMKRTEQELVRQRALLRSVLNCAAESVAVFDATGRLILWNPVFEERFGANAPDTSIQERFDQGVFTLDGKRPLSIDERPASRAIHGEMVTDMELVVHSPFSPAATIISTNARQLLDSTGAVVGAVVTGRDVTARSLAERKLVEQTKLLTSILDGLAESVVVYDPDGRIILTNPAAARAMDPNLPSGKTFEERTAHYGFYALDGAEPIEKNEMALMKALQGQSCDDICVLVRTPAHPEGIAFSTSGRPLHDPDGKTCGAVVTARDITARLRAEKEREDLLVELQRSNVELDQFAHVVSHDLRAPLRAIDSLARWLEQDLAAHLTPETAEQFQLLQGRVKRMEGLVADLLAFARIGRVAADVVSVDLDVLLAEVLELAAIPRTFRVVREISVFKLETAALPLKRALINLIGNAIKHHDRTDGEIRIAVRERGSFVEFEISDDGPGIPSQFHERIFEAFQTLKPRDVSEGSGMGLAFVKKIVEHARGTIAVESAGRGTTFRIGWPKLWRPLGTT